MITSFLLTLKTINRCLLFSYDDLQAVENCSRQLISLGKRESGLYTTCVFTRSAARKVCISGCYVNRSAGISPARDFIVACVKL